MAAGSGLRPPGPELAERNREILAARLGHPPETVHVCRELQARFPGRDVLFTGDSLDGDALGRDRAGVLAAPVRLGRLLPGDRERLSAGTHVIAHTRELPALLKDAPCS